MGATRLVSCIADPSQPKTQRQFFLAVSIVDIPHHATIHVGTKRTCLVDTTRPSLYKLSASVLDYTASRQTLPRLQ